MTRQHPGTPPDSTVDDDHALAAWLATVAGDLHVVGLRMVADFLEHDGWDALLLGASAPTETLVRLTLARKQGAHVYPSDEIARIG